MKLSTKSITSLMVITAVAAAVPGISKISITHKKRESQFDKLLQHHDRKGEVRAAVLGIDRAVLKRLQKKYSFGEIIRRNGFANERAFRLALLGYLRNELYARGWTAAQIDQLLVSRSMRFA